MTNNEAKLAGYYIKNTVKNKQVFCHCGCKAFYKSTVSQEEVFSCHYCHTPLSIYDTGEFISYSRVPDDLVTLMELVSKNKTIFVERNGTMGPGWYSKDNDDFSIAESIYKAGFRQEKEK